MSDAHALVQRANELHNAGKRLDAAPLYVEAARAFPPFASFALVAGDSFLDAGRHRDAADAYLVVIAEHPDHDEALDGLRKALIASGREAEARAAYATAGKPYPEERKGCFRRLFG